MDDPAVLDYVPVEATLGRALRLLVGDRGLKRFDLLARAGRVGTIQLDGTAGLARMESAEGAWYLNKRLRIGWELLIERDDGMRAGWYSGRRWLSGGTIFLTDGIQADLRRSLGPHWKLETRDTGQRLADIHGSVPPMRVTIRSRPKTTGPTSPLFLTALSVLVLSHAIGGVAGGITFGG